MKDCRSLSLTKIGISSASIILTFLLLIFAFHEYFQFFVAAIITFLTGIAIWEYAQFARAKGAKMFLKVLIALSFLETASFFVAAKDYRFQVLPVLIFFIGFLTLFAFHFWKKEGAILDMASSTFGLLYIAVPLGMSLGILYLAGQDGRWWIAYLLVVTKIADIGAYFAGSLWGRRKLAPTISPGKTVEGAVAGLVCAVSASYGFHVASIYVGALRFHLGTWEWILLGLILGIIGPFGDLTESILKRDANKKDSNNLPGLGGALDAIDSLLFTIPVLYIYLHFFKL